MTTIIAGTRGLTYQDVCEAMLAYNKYVSEVVSGCCHGVDKNGELWALNRLIPVKRFPANWSLGKKAGPMRNRQMAEYAEALVAVWDGKSRGTANMIEEATKRGLVVFIHKVEGGAK